METVVTRRSLGNDFENHLEAAYFVPSGNMGGPRVSEGTGGGVPSGSNTFAFPDRNMVPFVLFFEGNTQGFAPGDGCILFPYGNTEGSRCVALKRYHRDPV